MGRPLRRAMIGQSSVAAQNALGGGRVCIARGAANPPRISRTELPRCLANAMVLVPMLAEAKPQQVFEFDTIEDVLSDVARGKIVVVTDDADRENEGDLVIAAEKVTPDA